LSFVDNIVIRKAL